MNPTCPLVSDCAVELEGSVIVMVFPVFMRECKNNKKLMTCESRYYFIAFIFLLTADDLIIDKSENILQEYIKEESFHCLESFYSMGPHYGSSTIINTKWTARRAKFTGPFRFRKHDIPFLTSCISPTTRWGI